MRETQPIVALAFKAIALAMAVASIVMAALKVTSLEVYVVLLGVGLFALSIASLMQPKE